MVMKIKKKKESVKETKDGEDLVCVFLGLELYTTRKTAALLKANVLDLLNLKELQILAVKTHAPVELTPSLDNGLERVKTVLKKKSS